MTGSMLNLPLRAKWRIATVPFLAVILLMALASPFNLHAPAAAEGAVPTPTVTPTVTATPNSPPASAADTATSDEGDAQAQSADLFSEVEGDPPLSTDVETLAGRLVGIDFAQIAEVTKPPIDPKDSVTGTPPTPHTLVLNLFDDVVFTGIVEHVEPTASGHALWGSLDGVELGTMTLVVNGRIVVGTVRTPYAVYSIRTTGDGKYVIRQIDESSLPPLGEPLEIPPSSPGIHPKTDDGADALDDGSVIDVMVVYTPLAKHREGGRAAIEALIDLFVAESNQAYTNSGVFHRIRLVLREEVEYMETGYWSTDLPRLEKDSDGYMDHIHGLRDVYAADLVHFVVSRSDVCGVAGREFGLTVSACGGLTFAHELGHQMGLGHDRYTLGAASVPVIGSNLGYVNQRMFDAGAPKSARWRTIMAYGRQCSEVGHFGCPQVAYFSNPEITYNGDPMGVPADHPSTGVDGPADAVGSLNDRRVITANFRRSSTSPTPRMALTLSPYWLSENGGVSTVTATLHRPSSADTIVTVSVSPSDAVTLSGSRTLTIPAGRTEINDSVMITGIDNDDETGDVAVEVSATAENTSSLGVIAPEPVELTIADDETTPVVTLSLSPAEVFEGDDRGERRTLVTTSLDNRSSAATTVTLSASPAEAVEVGGVNPLTILAGQAASVGLAWLTAVDDTEFTESEKIVTVSGRAMNSEGITGPESVTLTVIDDDAPIFADESIAFTFTAGVAGHRVLPEASYGNGPLTYSLSPAPSNAVTFAPGPPASIGVNSTSVAADETSYTLTATDDDGDTDTMTVNITVIEGVCPDSTAVIRYTDPGIVRDCEALLASRDVLRGDQPLNWSVDLSIDNWQGIAIANNRVEGLDLSSLGLRGTIPPEIGILTSLQSLRLNGNELVGTIPPELRNLPNLQFLDLSGNGLAGPIPAQLGNLTNLESLVLYRNQLTGPIPSELGNLENLHTLRLGDNWLTGEIPSELGRLSNLQLLFLSDNQLTGSIPSELSILTKLSRLGIARNQLTGGIPVWLSGLSNLQLLHLSANQLGGPIPAELGDLEKLETLWLAGNELTGEVPVRLSGLSNLRGLALDSNQLVGSIPSELGNLANLVSLSLSSNQLTGPIPLELGNLDNLRSLFLGDNELDGGIPSELGNLVNLRYLWLQRNQLTGPISPAMRKLSNLEYLWLYSNQLTGPIPPELGNLTELKEFSLNDNQLTGPIPPELGNLANLEYLRLDDNQLTGPIPPELENLANLTWLYLGGNNLSGCMPERLLEVEINDLHVYVLPFCDGEIEQSACATGSAVPDAANNPGLISDCGALLAARDTLAGTATLNWSADTPIADWTGVVLGGTSRRVTELLLSGMSLAGEIPKELGSLPNLQTLDLSDNGLTGTIPAELGILSNLQGLYIGGNRLSGCVPDELRDIPSNDLASLDLPFCSEHPCVSGGAVVDVTNDGLLSDCETLLAARDALAGTVTLNWSDDISIANWSGVVLSGSPRRVTAIHLSWLGLTGEIPAQLGNLSNLVTLRLSANQLTGEIPKELENLMNLEDLSLGSNQLTGEIPKELGSLTNLVQLSLGSNQLDSEIPKELGSLSNLERLFLHTNQLTGEIPPDLGNITNLRQLSLSSNKLIGEIPAVLGNLSNLEFLGLAENQLTGKIPTELGSLSNLQHLSLSQNKLYGGIPLELGSLDKLQSLSLFDNELTGEIPTVLGSLSNLQQLLLTSNQLTGALPSALGDLASLGALWLSANQLDGEIPPELGSLSNLQQLLLNSNRLTGKIPTELGNLSNLQSLNLGWNQLTGEIPSEIANLSNLQTLSLTSNQLTGGIPTEFGNLSNLMRLYLRHNQLTGEIPTELGRLTGLTHLTLNDNDLEGSIPASLGSLTNLERLWLRDNRLTGCVPPRLQDIPHNDLEQLGLPSCPLSPPEAATIGSVTSEIDSLAISWAPPLSDGGSDITAYDLRYIETAADETADSNWTVVEDVWTATSGGELQYAITGLTGETSYDIQVRAENAEGDGRMVGNGHRDANVKRLCHHRRGDRCDEYGADFRL